MNMKAILFSEVYISVLSIYSYIYINFKFIYVYISMTCVIFEGYLFIYLFNLFNFFLKIFLFFFREKSSSFVLNSFLKKKISPMSPELGLFSKRFDNIFKKKKKKKKNYLS